MGADVKRRGNSGICSASWWGFSGASQVVGDICGECNMGRKLISATPWGFSHALKVIDAVLRGISQVCFANNPVSGLLIVIGLFMGSPAVGRASLICSFAAYVLAKYCGMGEEQVQNGLTQFNGVLVGTVVISLWPVLAGGELTPTVWALVVIGSATTVIVDRAVAGFLAGVKASHHSTDKESRDRLDLGVPGFTLPFNIVGWIVWAVLLRADMPVKEEAEAVERLIVEEVDWTQLFLGSLVAMSQVYGVYTIRGSLLMYLGIVIFSPSIAIAQWFGAILGCLTALVVGPSVYSGIYIGVWSYSALLTAGATVYFTQPSLRSLPLHILAVGSTVAVHACVAPILQQFRSSSLHGRSIAVFCSFPPPACQNAIFQMRLPAFTIPFVVTSWAFLLFSTGNGVVVRSASPLTPEQRIMAMREKSHMALAHIVKLTAGVAAGVEKVPAVLKDVKVVNASDLQEQVSLNVEQLNQTRYIHPPLHEARASQTCPTCPRGGHLSGETCRGLEAQGCFSCGRAGHFKGAPVCPGDGGL